MTRSSWPSLLTSPLSNDLDLVTNNMASMDLMSLNNNDDEDDDEDDDDQNGM